MASDKQFLLRVAVATVRECADSAVGQIARHLGWYARTDGKPARFAFERVTV